MTRRLIVSESLPRCFPLARHIEIGNQKWTLSYSALETSASEAATLTLLLSGPHARFRRVQIDLQIDLLLAGGYDADRAVSIIRAWLPYSDVDEVLDLPAASLARDGQLACPADD